MIEKLISIAAEISCEGQQGKVLSALALAKESERYRFAYPRETTQHPRSLLRDVIDEKRGLLIGSASSALGPIVQRNVTPTQLPTPESSFEAPQQNSPLRRSVTGTLLDVTGPCIGATYLLAIRYGVSVHNRLYSLRSVK